MFDSPDIDSIRERHDSDYINGVKNMFVSGFYDEPDDDDERWEDLSDDERRARLDALDKWSEWMFGRKPTKPF